MMRRNLFFLLSMLWSVNIAFAQQQPIANNVNAMGQVTREWKVSYDKSENWQVLGYKNRGLVGIRLQITYDEISGDHSGQLWFFKWSDVKNKPDLAGKTDKFVLKLEGQTGGRKRLGFNASQVDLKTDDGTTKINVNGIWQHGRNVGSRASQRIQLKVNRYPMMANGGAPAPERAPSDCEDDPDTDVLEEGDTPPNPDDPPTDP